MMKAKFCWLNSGRLLAFCVAAALTQVAPAEEPTVSAPALATSEATLDFCAKTDPKTADRYRQQGSLVLQAVPEETTAEILESDAYREAYNSATEMLGKLPQPEAMHVCTDSLAALLEGGSSPPSAMAQSPRTPATQTSKAATAAARPQAAPTLEKSAARHGKVPPAAAAHRYQPDRFAGRAGAYYRLVWGVDDLQTKWAESGEVIRFTYRVLDARKAKVLNDGKNEPSLIDPLAQVRLVVPSMENVGQLRQTAAPEGGKSYWIVFSNKGRLVKRGDHVSVLIGSFHADGLVVD